MATIEKFLGRQVEMPEDRRYVVKPGLWARGEGAEVRFGLTEPELVLIAGINDLEWLVGDGEAVEAGESVAIAITGKIKYLDAPLSGVFQTNPQVKKDPGIVSRDPYGQGWLFQIRPGSGVEKALGTLPSVEAYIAALRQSEGCKNPEGLKGGVSGMCKAVYGGIKEQKF